MIRLFASSAIASIMAKNGTKENFSSIAIFERNFAEAEITLGLFLIFTYFCLKIIHKKVNVYLTKIEGISDFCDFRQDGIFCIGQSITLRGGVGQSITRLEGGG